MNTTKIAEQIFLSNIEKKFLYKYESESSYLGSIGRILKLGDNDISDHSLSCGLALKGCIEEYNNLWNTYIKMNNRYDINVFYSEIYDYIKYIDLKFINLNFEKIIKDNNSNQFIKFMNNLFTNFFLLKIDNFENKNSEIYLKLIKNLIKEILYQLNKECDHEVCNEMYSFLGKIFKSIGTSMNDFYSEFLNLSKDEEVNYYIKIVYKSIFYEIFNLGSYNKFNKMIIRNLFFEVMKEMDENIKVYFFKKDLILVNKYLKNKALFFNSFMFENFYHNFV